MQRHFALISSLLFGLLAVLQPVLMIAQEERRCFPETGLCIAGRIRAYWEQNGGLAVFGYPITPQQEERTEGLVRQVQWFERNRLELHPENAPPYDVLLGRLGAAMLDQQGRDWQAFPPGEPQEGCAFFTATHHTVCADFLTAWRSSGLELDGQPGTTEDESLALFGLPLSEPQQETLSDGQVYTVQWFERARFEAHPEHEPPYHVLFGLLGNEMHTSPPVQPEVTPSATPTPSPTDTLPLPGTERIVFDTNRDGNNEIYVMYADGTRQANLTNHPAHDLSPAWSPDGRQIAFVSNRSGGLYALYVMEADGSDVRQVVAPTGRAGNPDWSPDGSRIAFDVNVADNPDIYVVDVDGSNLVQLTDNPLVDYAPDWSPDGRQIAFYTNRDGNDEVYVMQADGSGQTNLSNFPGFDTSPKWSPDGRQIAFSSSRDAGFQVYVMQADGSEQTRLTGPPGRAFDADWSPDGRSMVCVVNQGDSYEIYRMQADGSGLQRLTTNEANDSNPRWSPQGSDQRRLTNDL